MGKVVEPELIYEDTSILVVYKPSLMATESRDGSAMDLVSWIRNYRARKGEEPYVGVVSRLDQPVEGILCFGKTKAAAEALSRQLRERKSTKKYIAVTSKSSLPKEGILTDYLVKDSQAMKAKVVSPDDPRAKKAELSYRIMKELDNEFLMEISLKTGRFHQIRVQLAYRMTPIVGDIKYGGRATGGALALCAKEVSFLHPGTGKPIHFEINPCNPELRKFL